MIFDSVSIVYSVLFSSYCVTTTVSNVVNNDIIEPVAVLEGHTDTILTTKFASHPTFDRGRFDYHFLSSSTEIILYDPAENWKGLGIVRKNSGGTSFDYANNIIVMQDGDRLFRVIKLYESSFWCDKDIVIDLNTQYNTVFNNPPALNHDGSRVVFGSNNSNNYNVYLHSTLNGDQILVLQGHTRSVYRSIFSPDGTKIATGSHDQTARIWDADTGETLHVLESHTGRVFSLCFSPDGKQLATGSSDRTLKLWDVDTGRLLATFSGAHDGEVRSLAMADIPDGGNRSARRILASGSLEYESKGTVNVWDIENVSVGAGPIATRKTSSAWSISFSPDGEYLAVGQVHETEIFKVSEFLYGPQTDSPMITPDNSPFFSSLDKTQILDDVNAEFDNNSPDSASDSLSWSKMNVGLISLLWIVF